MYTFGEIKRIVAPYAGRAGKCATSADTSLFARQVMQHLLLEGSEAAIRVVCLIAHEGCISLPPEVETPLKAKIGERVAEIWSKWCSFHSASRDFEQCPPLSNVMKEEGATTPLIYDLPHGGSVIAIMGTCDEGDDATVLIQGKDPTGREIYTMFDGKQVPGEKFRIKKDEIRFGQVVFGQITAVNKPRTSGYVSLFAVNPTRGTKQFLADWSPVEEKPTYRRYKITSRDCPSLVKVSMLCRVKVKDNYFDDEVTFFDNSLALLLAAQRLNSETNNDAQMAGYKMKALSDTLEKEAAYKKSVPRPVDVYYPLSGGAIKNIT